MQRMVIANSAAPVTITPLASFDTANTPALRFGYYTPGDPTDSTELFHIGKVEMVKDPWKIDNPPKGN